MMHVKVSDSSPKSSSSKSTTDEKLIELPVEKERYILMSMLKAEFPDACGLKFKTERSSWQDLRVVDDKIFPLDEEKWDEKSVYYVTYPKDLAEPNVKKHEIDEAEEFKFTANQHGKLYYVSDCSKNKLKFGKNQLDFYSGNDSYKCLYNDFLQKAIKIAEAYLNDDDNNPKGILTKYFKVSLDKFKHNLLQVEIRFEASPSSFPSFALSWKDKNKLNINSIFWRRYSNTKNQQERKIIIFFVAMCILHEIAHLALQWTDSKEFKRINGCVQTPPKFGREAGLFFERRLFGGDTLALIVSTDGEWNENKEITAAALDKCNCKSRRKKCICNCTNDRYIKLKSSFIDFVWNVANDDETGDSDLFLFETVDHAGLESNEMAFKRSDENKDECSSCEDKNKQTNLSSSGLKEGEKAFQLCGTHLLPQNRFEDEDSSQ